MSDASSLVLRVVNENFSSNTYFVPTANAGECVVIDPGLSPGLIEDALKAAKLKPIAVLSTHGHFDHMGSAKNLQEAYGTPYYLAAADQKIAKSAAFFLMACKVDAKVSSPRFDHLVATADWIEIGGFPLRFVAVPGHTPGSSFIEYRGALFTGDTMYKNAVGLVNFPGEDPVVMKASLLKIWDFFDEKLIVYPGHGGHGQLGEIKQKNVKLRAFLGLDPGAKFEAPARMTGAEMRSKFDEEVE